MCIRDSGRAVPADQVDKKICPMDFILDASGIAQLEFNLLDALAVNGIYVLTGIPGGDRTLQIPGAELIRQLVLENQVMLGSVNAARGHFQMAADDLAQAHLHWGAQIASLITHRYPWDQFARVMAVSYTHLDVYKRQVVTGAGQIILRHLSSGNGIDTTAAIWFHAGRMPAWRTLGSALLSVVIRCV